MNEIAPHQARLGHAATQAADGFPRLAWTLAEFERLSAQGYFGGIDGPRERVELVDGELVPMAAKGARHELVRGEVIDRLSRKMKPGMRCYVELGWRPGGDLYLEPDLLILPFNQQPTITPPADAVLLIEVANTSLGYDRTVKAEIYARLGAREYWSIDANTLETRVHLDPATDGYRSKHDFGRDSLLLPKFAPELALALAELGIDPI